MLDLIGAILSLYCTYLFTQMDRRGWPLGLCANCLNWILYFQSKLYADCGLEIFFFITTLYGWLNWQMQTAQLKVFRLNLQQILTFSIIALLLTWLFSSGLTQYTDSTTPYIDSLATSLSIVAQLLLARRYLENWYVWLLADSLFALLYLSKGLYFHAGMMICLLGLALRGIKQWARLDTDHIESVPQAL